MDRRNKLRCLYSAYSTGGQVTLSRSGYVREPQGRRGHRHTIRTAHVSKGKREAEAVQAL